MDELEKTIEGWWTRLNELSEGHAPKDLSLALEETFSGLEEGTLRVAEKTKGEWMTRQWVKKAILLYFRVTPSEVLGNAQTLFFDKVPSLFSGWEEEKFKKRRLRVVPPAHVRRGVYLGEQVVVMPSFVNVGAWVGEGTMIDTWATVGSCAQIGRGVHLSGGVGIGGVLEPLQASPTIIEDQVFVGARSEIVEGVIVEEGAVIGMGVYLSSSTKIYDRTTGEVSTGRVPAGAVVVPGALAGADGRHSLYCAVIVKKVDAATRAKVGVNALLRGD